MLRNPENPNFEILDQEDISPNSISFARSGRKAVSDIDGSFAGIQATDRSHTSGYKARRAIEEEVGSGYSD